MKAKRLWAGVLCALLLCALVPAASAGNTVETCSDIQGHWAQEEIQTAIDQGWVDGYPDGTFRPNAPITRGEFVKMLLSATHMTPDSDTVRWMEENLVQDQDEAWISVGGLQTYQPTLSDTASHWLTKQGWTRAALASGVVVPTDYTGQNFQPNQSIRRWEIAVMADRALGLVSAAQQGETDALSFSDVSSIQDQVKGYVNEAAKAGVVDGYPNGSFGPNRTATRAEAVVMVSRALAYMETGLQPDTTVVIQYGRANETQTHQTTLTGVTTQMVDGTLYVPLREVFQAWHGLNAGGSLQEFWNPLTQCYYNYSVAYDWTFSWKIKAGCPSFIRTEVLDTVENSPYSFLAAPRMLYGELMIPVYRADADGDQWNLRFSNGWDPASQTLTLTLWKLEPVNVS